MVHHLVDPGVVAPDAEVARLDAQRLAHREERVEHQLLGHHAEHAPRAPVVFEHVRAHHACHPRSGPRQAGNAVDERSLAGAVGAEHAEELALPDRAAHARERAHGAEALVELLDLDGVQWGGAATGSRPSTPYRRAIVCSDAGRLVKESSFWRALASRSHARASASKEESISVTSPRSTLCTPSSRWRLPSSRSRVTLAKVTGPLTTMRRPSRRIISAAPRRRLRACGSSRSGS